MTLSIKPCIISEFRDEFVALYESVFNQWTIDGNCPYSIYLLYDDERLIGFASGFIIGVNTWYLQRAGFIKSEQRKVSNLYRASFTINEILKEWPYIMSFISNEDTSTLRMVMALGFKIIGTRIDTLKSLWVEFLISKEK